jgi:CobQ-like glutamine amidotransferase family enzyme
VSKVISLGAISPTHLNLNGDLGNLLVLKKRLEWRNVETSIEHLNGSEDLNDFDFILVGHGSNAAWKQLLDSRSDLLGKLVAYVESEGALLAVASAADRLQPLLTGVEVTFGDRVSEFLDVDGVVGYKNSGSNAENLSWYKNALLTQLHGPVFAKNPELADQIISSNGWADISLRSQELDAVDELAAQSRKTAFEH